MSSQRMREKRRQRRKTETREKGRENTREMGDRDPETRRVKDHEREV